MRNNKTVSKRRRDVPPILKEFEPMLRELTLARRRLDDEGGAAWLLRFAFTDLESLSQGGLSDARYDVYAFGLPPRDPTDLKGDALTNLRPILDLLTSDPDLVAGFQKQLRTRFESAKEGKDWEWTYPQRGKSFQLFGNVKPVSGYGGQGGMLGTGIEHLVSLATDLLERERGLFGVCENPRCGSPFVAQRKREVRFCSPRCSAYVRVTRAREKQK